MGGQPRCCPQYHEAVELIGRRWTGAILEVMTQHGGPMRFSQIAHAVPQLSDRLLSERLKELEQRGIVARHEHHADDAAEHPRRRPRVAYELTAMGKDLQPALAELKAWAQEWIDLRASRSSTG